MYNSVKYLVIAIGDEKLKECLNAIRLIGNPEEKHDAHLTVRGPYIGKRGYHGRDSNSMLKQSYVVRVTSVDNFFEHHQNTVFFSCMAPNLKSAWWKPDYPYNPHITLYDGPSREFAEALYSLFRLYSFRINFESDGLIPLRRSEKNGSMMISFLEESLSANAKRHFSLKLAASTDSQSIKLEVIRDILDYLCELGYANFMNHAVPLNSLSEEMYT